jgi:hypothetical protein
MSNSTDIVRVQHGEVARQEFGADQLARSAETSQTAMAEQARAEVEARFVMAVKRPRNEYDARAKMLNACARPAFAQAAIYRKPIGGGKAVEGLSIRFAEEAARAWRNVHVSVVILSDDSEKRILRVTAEDLEANISESLPVIVEKYIERKFVKQGETPIKSRLNTYGELVYLFPADEGRLLTKQAAEVAKAKRQCVLHLIPGDILDEARARCFQVMADEDARDPEAAKKALFDAFGGIGVKPSEIEQYLNHALDSTSPAELGELRGVFLAVKDGDCSWTEALGAKLGVVTDGKVDPKIVAIKDKIAEKTQKANAKKGAPPKAKAAPREDTGEVSDEQQRGMPGNPEDDGR